MKTTIYICDLCRQEFDENYLYESLLGQVCARCIEQIDKLYSKALQELQGKETILTVNKLAFLSLLKRTNKDLWKQLFGDGGLEVLELATKELKEIE